MSASPGARARVPGAEALGGPWAGRLGRRLSALAALAASFASASPLEAQTKLPPSVAYNYGENETPRSAAMSGALRGLGNGSTAMFLNPANMVETRVYHIEGLAQIVPEVDRQIYGGAIVDSVTGRLAGGISVVGGFVDRDGLDRSLIDLRFALAYPLSDKIFVGVGARYTKVSQDAKPDVVGGFGGPDLDKAAGGLVDPEGGRFAFVNAFTFDAGITARLTDMLHVSALGQNLTYPNNAILPTSVGGGFGVGTKDFSIEADGLADFNSWPKTTARFMVGGELLAGDHFPLRLGYRYDQGADLHALSAGLGYIATEFAVEAAVRRTLSDPGATTIVIGLAYYLESSGFTRAPGDLE